MAWWKKLFGDHSEVERVDYYREGLDLLAAEKYHDALTSFRLALRESPGDVGVLQQIAIAYTRVGMTDEAAKTYRHVLQKDPSLAGAHYGLAFLLYRAGDHDQEVIEHLRAFLELAASDPAAARHAQHARDTLAALTGDSEGSLRPDGRGS